MNPRSLLDRYLLGEVTEADVRQLDRLLAHQPELRREYIRAVAAESGLREIALERSVHSTAPAQLRQSRQWRFWGIAASVVAVLLLMVLLIPTNQSADTVATLVSSENAAWESALPTLPGSQLTAGTLKLRTGIATLGFPSGAELILEAPAQIELISTMRCRLLDGVALVEVPESAVGFIVETPSGYAVDYGTCFSVKVDPDRGESDFELIEGEIGVHHASTGDEIRLTQPNHGVKASAETLRAQSREELEEMASATTGLVRIGTDGRATSVLPNNKRHKFVDPEVLSVRKTENGKWDYRSFFSFDLTGVEFNNVRSARLRLNLVPSRRGLASRLPLKNQFGVYGLTNSDKADWSIDATWEDSPTPEDGVLLGTFEILRSAQRGTYGIANEELLQFLRQNSDRNVTLILVRLTTQIEGKGPVLTHMFASDSHPEAVGPLLELTLDRTAQKPPETQR